MEVNQKKTMRQKFLALRRALSSLEIAKASAEATDILIQSELWQKSETLGLYMPIRSELDTNFLWEKALKSNKKLFFPRCLEELGQMNFVQCTSLQDFELAKYNILEPKANLAVWTKPIDLILVPALAYDFSGYRLGYGGGYYDRLLVKEQFSSAFTLGFAYAFQLVPALAYDSHDVRLQAICTNQDLHFCL